MMIRMRSSAWTMMFQTIARTYGWMSANVHAQARGPKMTVGGTGPLALLS